MSHKLKDLQAKTNRLAEEAGQGRAAKNGPPPGERREDRGDEDTQPPLPTTTTTSTMSGRNLKEVVCFTYLRSIISTTNGGGTDEDVKATIGKTAKQVFINLWRSALSMKNKIRIFNTDVS
ncbi:unnamed protein product [Heterobilharzia americana]|nr:unnamed protein product [Heterobilharzia americana]